ncbi:hypothetical protein BsWGS_11199 [Bradybaena similaris]
MDIHSQTLCGRGGHKKSHSQVIRIGFWNCGSSIGKEDFIITLANHVQITDASSAERDNKKQDDEKTERGCRESIILALVQPQRNHRERENKLSPHGGFIWFNLSTCYFNYLPALAGQRPDISDQAKRSNVKCDPLCHPRGVSG